DPGPSFLGGGMMAGCAGAQKFAVDACLVGWTRGALGLLAKKHDFRTERPGVLPLCFEGGFTRRYAGKDFASSDPCFVGWTHDALPETICRPLMPLHLGRKGVLFGGFEAAWKRRYGIESHVARTAC